jgi:hypothetical protein
MANSPRTQISGKLVIGGIVALALMAAGTSWLFRYSATHRALQFWGSEGARLIRDAPTVELIRIQATDETKDRAMHFRLWSGEQVTVTEYYDVSGARGITHLRNALLEDRSYAWPPREGDQGVDWRWMIGFRDESRSRRIFMLFTEDCTRTALLESDENVISCQPIANGLCTMFAEFATDLPPVR